MQLYICGLHTVHGPRNFSVQQTWVALAIPRGNVKQCVSLNVPLKLDVHHQTSPGESE